MLARRATVAILIAALGACSKPALTADAYADKANAICRTISDRFRALPAPSGPADLTSSLQHALEASETGALSLRALTPPAALEAKVNEMVAGIDQANAALRKAIDAARVSDQKALAVQSNAIGTAQQRFRRAADALGLLDCETAGTS